MADETNYPNTHFASVESKIYEVTSAPSDPVPGDAYYDTSLNKMCIYDGSVYKCASFSTTTSTSTSVTTSSTSVTSSSTSRTTSTSTSTSTSISTTTTL